jgi:hypothetical protein
MNTNFFFKDMNSNIYVTQSKNRIIRGGKIDPNIFSVISKISFEKLFF